MIRFVAVLLACLFSVGAIAADEKPRYDLISLSASASGRVDNDTMTATLFTQEEGADAASLANLVNQRISWGVNLAKQNEDFKVQTQSYNTQPIYHKNNITGWRVRQSFRIEAQDMAQLSDMLGKLQEKLGLEGVSFSVSPEQRNTAENDLIAQALKAFEERAAIIAKNLTHSDYKLVNLNVGTSGGAPMYQARGMRMEMMAADVAAPTMVAGDSQLTVNVSGQIELN